VNTEMERAPSAGESTVSADDRVYKLIRPIVFNEQTITELTLDFDELNGFDLVMCAKQAMRMEPEEVMSQPVRAFSLTYQIVIAAKAAKVVPELIKSLKGADFSVVTQKAANFLMGQG
jgi:hypothetical protein